ncbi:MAG: FAD-binding protein [Actinomycetes bacterium]
MGTDRRRGSQVLLSGWGGTSPSRAEVRHPFNDADVRAAVRERPGRGLVARGLGRAYGDAAQNSGGLVLDATAMRGVRHLDVERGRATVAAGTSLDDLMRWLLPAGFFLVTPGTRSVTVGGAIASDIHGKGHHADGTLGSNVRALTLVDGTGTERRLTPEEHPAEFWATTGGMGLTGVITEAEIDLIPVETSMIRADTERATDLDDLMARMDANDDDYRYSVAWIDCLATGRSMGRGILDRGDHATLDDLKPSRRANARAFDPHAFISAPPIFPSGLVNRWTVRAFNELWFRKSPKRSEGHLVDIGWFFHPLDLITGWNRLYGPRGFVQYQFVVPFGQERAVQTAVERLSLAGTPSLLAVLKRFGPANPAPLSFPQPGWTLALDIPVGDPTLGNLLDGLDELVLDAGGRVYLAKDARVRPEHLAAMYPRLEEWREVRRRLDPDGVLQSDLARRLGL